VIRGIAKILSIVSAKVMSVMSTIVVIRVIKVVSIIVVIGMLVTVFGIVISMHHRVAQWNLLISIVGAHLASILVRLVAHLATHTILITVVTILWVSIISGMNFCTSKLDPGRVGGALIGWMLDYMPVWRSLG
jgi:hypothetical protein